MSASTALEALTEATAHAGHQYWPLDRDIVAGLKSLAPRMHGHQQWTAVLLWQVVGRKGVLVTFDAGVKKLADRDLASHVLLLKQA
ncbi:MAG: hypothetical protein LAP40_10770 [Acidobacteriia bacterium]|nr:hypothetical protein [Terriglobia bacterium]